MSTKLTFKPKGSPHEIVRYVRAHYKAKDQNDPDLDRVLSDNNESRQNVPDPKTYVQTRTSKVFLTAVDNDEKAWQDKYTRKRTTLRQGYFTGCTEPFRPVGGNILELGDLIEKAVGESLCDKARLELTKRSEKSREKVESKSRRQSSKPVDWEKSNDAILSDAVKSHIKSAGFEYIREAIAATHRRLVAVKSSTAFATTVKKEQQAKELAKEKHERNESRGMVLSRLSSGFLCAIDIERIPSAEGRNVIANVSKDETEFDIQFTNMDDEFKFQPKRVRIFLQKLKCIYVVLMSISNLRNKYLKNKLPLKWDFVKQLRKDTNVEKDSRASHAFVQTIQNQVSHQVKVSTSTLLSTAESGGPRPQSVAGSVDPNGSPSKIVLPPIKARGSIIDNVLQLGRRNKYQRRIAQKDELKLDSWEDLLAVNPGDNKRVKSHRKTPPWQQSWNHERPKSKVDKQSEEESIDDIDEGNLWNRFERQKDYLMDVKSSFRRQVEKRLAKLERERLYKGKRRLASLNKIYPLWPRQLAHLREATCPQNILSQNAGSSISVELAQWFIHLKNESVNLHLEDDPKTQRRLNNLERFAREDLEAAPLIREKLCLLVSSLPAHEICTPQMQNAIKFVLGEVLMGDDPTDMLRRWLQYRNLYVLSP